MTQRDCIKQLITSTLYKKQLWSPQGKLLEKKQFLLQMASTIYDDKIITVNYDKKKIFIDKKAIRISKTLATDLFTIVKLKITKLITKHASFN